ncbi:MAG: ferritin-like domain-containing protein [Hydrogenobacter sp.]|uniref:ferritin-like domain-containing protein n=1 Tax=Hydrogenobacter thermophilus TaxID=940 RepID=UPI0030F7FD55
MNKKELIALLLYDVALEHSAIVQYLYHIFLITDKNITEEVEVIARQEMRHLKWFAQKVVKLGGQVVLNRLEDMIVVGGPDWEDMMAKDVDAEQMAIDTYTKQLEIVKDDDVKKLLERVIKDEEDHKIEFTELMQLAKETILLEGETKRADQQTLDMLNRFLKEEYQTIINYLYQFFHTKDCAYRDIMLDLAIESMTHMGKIGEKIGEFGAMPDISADLSPKPLKELQKQVTQEIEYEQSTKEDYKKQMESLKDPQIQRLFTFIENQEEYHKHMLMEFFKTMRRLTVGNLKRDT